MCGIGCIFGEGWQEPQLEAMIAVQRHRGPDDCGTFVDQESKAGLAHARLKILDLSAAGQQPMQSSDGSLWISFNGEIYNYLELRSDLRDYPFQSSSDTEVILAAYTKWGPQCLDRLVGMFSFVIWDTRTRCAFAARDRFGVKPLYYHLDNSNTLFLSSEIKGLHAAGVARAPDVVGWANYLANGVQDRDDGTFWSGITALPAGHCLIWQNGQTKISRWYDLAERVAGEYDPRPASMVQEEYKGLLEESVRLRFRSDVPVGINLSGGLDSSVLLGLVRSLKGPESDIKVFTFATGDPRYDETPWVRQMLQGTKYKNWVCQLDASEVPDLAGSVQQHQDEPFGGLPTIAYARLFECARADGKIVLLDGQGMDEQWAGYDYYRSPSGAADGSLVQGMKDSPVRKQCLVPEFRDAAAPLGSSGPFPDPLRNLQYRDITRTKIPRALRFNDRASMRASTELREPFLDHRLVELSLRQRPEYKIRNGTSKWLLRQLAARMLPDAVTQAPKRPLQTPQREWLRGPLRGWADDCIESALGHTGGSWLDTSAVRQAWQGYCAGQSDNSFYIWQWISVGMMMEQGTRVHG